MSLEIARPDPSEHHEYFLTYINKLPDTDFVANFAAQPQLLETLLGDLPAGEDAKLHQPYTWTLKQVVGHLIDTERIFCTRLLRIATGDETPNPDFEHNNFVAALNYEDVSMRSLLDEFSALRSSNLLLVRRLTADQLARVGTASGRPLSARATLFIMAGHIVYHYEIMQRRLAK